MEIVKTFFFKCDTHVECILNSHYIKYILTLHSDWV